MVNFKSTERKVHNLESEDLELEKDRETLSGEVLDRAKSEEDYNHSPELNQKAANLTTSNIANKHQSNYEAQAVEFKAKALFELEQVIIEIEQFKQICQ